MTIVVESLPDEPLFHHILDAFRANPRFLLFYDWIKGTEASCLQLLTDILCMRRRIVQTLPVSMFDSRNIIIPQRPFILVLAPGNYEFVVAAFGVLCCGAAFSPISSNLSPEEAIYILELTNASCILFAPEFEEQASTIQQHAASKENGSRPLITIPIASYNELPTPRAHVKIDKNKSIDPQSPGVLVFTSGTTGPPKGIVRPRSIWYTLPESFPSGGIALCFRPAVRGATAMPLLWRAVNGVRTEIIGDEMCQIWERLRTGDVTHLNMVPSSWRNFIRYFNEQIEVLPANKRNEFLKGARSLQKPVITGDFLEPKTMELCRDLLGRHLINIYGSTEMGAVISTTEDQGSIIERCIGKPREGVQVRLSEGDHGDILIKSPMMFTSYLGNEVATRAAFDGEGYYRTGDVGRRVGDQYVLEGRSATDVIRCYGLWVPLQEVEARLAELPYISEAYVVPVEFNCIQQIAALVRLTNVKVPPSLLNIRGDLQDKLQKYKLPTLLRILRNGERILQSASGKVMRKEIVESHFQTSIEGELPREVDFCDAKAKATSGRRKAWDWAGMV
ncbi:uncharacterized protein N7500_010425 [Penicillium coprophilum]|uniref:uncharacterized protein n=1 Tax=Penicillium coprophilum TaxID=36646 RepID=UPI00238A6AFC|nr:uncharacterized protein N7500_010425 [Penicillium coprophilum]KAJ5154986.1 hypothetical protein N7500_010425 [Penicillium coprophilum]